MILGLGSIITPLHLSPEFNGNLLLLCVSTLVIWLFNFIGKKNTITKFQGFILFSIFVMYIVKLFI